MTRMMEVVNQGWFGIVVGATIGLLLYFRAKRDPHLSYRHATQTLIARVPESLRGRVLISFDGHPTDDLLSTRLVIWNSGSAAIRSDSFPPGGGLTIKFDELSDVVGFDIAAASNPLNGSELLSDAQGILVGLKYLNPGDGVIIDILHRSEAGALKVTGVLLGQRNGITYEGKVDNEVLTKDSMWLRIKSKVEDIWWTFAGFGILYVGNQYWMAYDEGRVITAGMSSGQHIFGAILMVPFGLFLCVVGLVSMSRPSRHPPRFPLDSASN